MALMYRAPAPAAGLGEATTGLWRYELFANQLRRMTLVMVLAVSMLLLLVGTGLAQDTTVNVTLGMSEFKFEPAELDVPLNTTVTFSVTNTGDFPHNVTFVAPDGTETNLFAENLTTGQSATGTFTFNAAGEWRMYCPVGEHEEQGMVGTVRVAAAGVEAAQQTEATPTATPAPSGAAATAASPATLPRTGSDSSAMFGVAGGIMLLASALLFAGLRLRRTH
jgi:LPXTG-motif cell wall-anchored protein